MKEEIIEAIIQRYFLSQDTKEPAKSLGVVYKLSEQKIYMEKDGEYYSVTKDDVVDEVGKELGERVLEWLGL